MKPTIKEVAKEAGVSITTISNFLNGNYGNMSENTKNRVEQVVDELNYYPSIGARSLPRKGNSHTVCIVIPHSADYTFNHPYFSEVLKGISSVVDEKKYRLLILMTKDKKKNEVNYLKSLKQGVVDGFILFDIDKDDPYVHEFSKSSIPFMAVGQYEKGKGNYVDTDITNGAYMAVSHLIGHGHERIGLILGSKSMIFTEQIISGCKNALREYNLKYCKELIECGAFSNQHGYHATMRLLQGNNPPTAFFSASIQTTYGVIQALSEKGLQFPGEVALISFGENKSFEMMNVSMSSVIQPEFQVGVRVAEKLLELIEQKEYVTKPDILPVRLDIRKSCGC